VRGAEAPAEKAFLDELRERHGGKSRKKRRGPSVTARLQAAYEGARSASNRRPSLE